MEYQYLLLIFSGPINVFVERMRSQRADKLTFVAIFLYYADGIWIAAESLEDGLDYLGTQKIPCGHLPMSPDCGFIKLRYRKLKKIYD